MDKVSIRNLEVFAKHGVFPEERSLGQKFIITVELFADLRNAGKTDELENTFDYGRICHVIKRYMEGTSYKLIEAVAEGLAEKLLNETPLLQKVRIEIIKPWAPVQIHLESISVEIERSRHIAYISLGSNIGDREGYLNFGVKELKKARGCKVIKTSGFINTKPYGVEEQDDYLNGCLMLDTLLEPGELLELLKDIENKAEREQGERWGPRTLDLDITFFDDAVISNERLRIPHPDMHNREFVLQPLCEIAPHLIHPIFKKTMAQLLEELNIRD